MMGEKGMISGAAPRSKSEMGEVLLRLPALEIGRGACTHHQRSPVNDGHSLERWPVKRGCGCHTKHYSYV
jgi:hypothetical protein